MKTVEVTDELQAYMDGLVAKRDAVLARMEEEAEKESIPIVGPHEGALLSLLVKTVAGKRLLELGTATGYSGLCLLRGTSGGALTTYEVDHKRAVRARANFSEAGFGERALVLEQDAVTGLQKLDERFDVCFIDLLNSFPSEEVTHQVFDLCMERLDGGRC
ncbi:MAG: O-methyltransferase [Candidatus Dormibacterales bacterium]